MYSWWISDSGEHMLRGEDSFDEEELRWIPDPANPCKLPRNLILDLLRRIPQARISFDRDYTRIQWTEGEQRRIDEISTGDVKMLIDTKTNDDSFQKRQNTAGIYTTGPHGGKRQ